MDKGKYVTRRQALKTMGTLAAGAGLGISNLHGANSISILDNQANGRKMKVLLVNGSPHKEGCTYTALSEVSATLSKNGIETDFFWIGTEPLAGCIGCNACKSTGKCFRNDVVNEFIDKIDDYDGFVFGSPVHFGTVAGAMMSFLDRAFYVGAIQHPKIMGKPGAAIVSCRREGSTATLDQLNKYIIGNNMPMVPSQLWNVVHGNTPDEVRQDKEGLQIMRTLAQNMAWIMKCIEAGREAGIHRPVYEEFTPTNFIR